MKNHNHIKVMSFAMVSSSSFLLLLSILFTNDATISVAATNDKDILAFPLSSNYDDILQQESTIRKLFENDYMEDSYFETDADTNQLEVTSRRNPRPRCQLCPYKKEIGDPDKFFTSSYGKHFRGTCKGFYDTQEDNMAKPGQGGYSRDLCGALKSDFKDHCKCVPEGTTDGVTKCLKQQEDECDPNQSGNQCCIGSCQYVNKFRRNFCIFARESRAKSRSVDNKNTNESFHQKEDTLNSKSINNNVDISSRNHYMEDTYFETDTSKNQLDVTSRVNPSPLCYLCRFGEEVGDPNKFFISSYSDYTRGTCKQIYDDQIANMGQIGQGGYARDKCRALKSDYKKHCKCVPEGTGIDVTRCKEQLKDICDPNQSDDQCCIGSCRYVNRYRRNLCTTTTENPTRTPIPTMSPVARQKVCEVNVTIDVSNIDPISSISLFDTRCSKRSKSFGFKYTGGNCLSSNNIQAFPCKNFETVVPMLNKDVSFIRVTDTEESKKIYFEDFVEVGGFFTLHDNDGTNLIADKINVTIYSATAHDMLNSVSQPYMPSPDLIIETMTFNTDCDQDLFLCDSFGSLMLVSFENESDGFISSVTSSVETYKLTIENTGNETLTLESLSLAVNEANAKGLPSLIFNYTEQRDTNLRPGERFSLEQKVMISSKAQTRHYEAQSYITAQPLDETNSPCFGFDHRFTTYEGCNRG